MSVSQSNPKPSRPAPFSLRLTTEEREQLQAQAGAMPLASYIKSVVLADVAPKYRKRAKPPVAEQQLLAEVLAKLGATRSANNLNQIAKAIHQGTLYVDDELEADLNAAIAEIVWGPIYLTSQSIVSLLKIPRRANGLLRGDGYRSSYMSLGLQPVNETA